MLHFVNYIINLYDDDDDDGDDYKRSRLEGQRSRSQPKVRYQQ